MYISNYRWRKLSKQLRFKLLNIMQKSMYVGRVLANIKSDLFLRGESKLYNELKKEIEDA